MTNPYDPPAAIGSDADEKPRQKVKQSPNQLLIKLLIFLCIVVPILIAAIAGFLASIR